MEESFEKPWYSVEKDSSYFLCAHKNEYKCYGLTNDNSGYVEGFLKGGEGVVKGVFP